MASSGDNSPFARQSSSISLREQYLAQGVSTREANQIVLRDSLEVLLTRSRLACVWIWLSFILLLGFAGCLGYSLTIYAKNHDDYCDQPLWTVVWLLWVIGLLSGFRKEISKCVCCYDHGRDGPVIPRRVRLLRSATVLLAVVWPFVALIYLGRTRICSQTLQSMVQWLAYYYLVAGSVIVIFPLFAVSITLCLIRRGFVRLAGENNGNPALVNEFEEIPFEASEFDDDSDDKFYTECPICLDQFSSAARIICTPCPNTDGGRGHVFHRQCMESWLQLHTSCPLCRTDLQEVRRQTGP